MSHVLDSLKSMRELEDARDIDAENFYRLVLIVRSISISRPQNFAKFTEQYTNKPIDETNGKLLLTIYYYYRSSRGIWLPNLLVSSVIDENLINKKNFCLSI